MKKGFTLVELLVVIAIIAILLLLMAPSYSTMMERARRNACSNNHHQIMVGASQYQANYGTYLGFPNWLWPEWQASPRGWVGPGWLYDISAGVTPGTWKAGDRETGWLWTYLKAEGLYRCPLEPGPYRGSNQLTSYLMTGAVIDFGRDWSAAGSRRMAKSTDMNPLGVVFWEADEPGWNDGSSTPNEGLTIRHRDGATFGCADGHTEYLTRQQYNIELSRRPSMLWCNPFQANGS